MMIFRSSGLPGWAPSLLSRSILLIFVIMTFAAQAICFTHKSTIVHLGSSVAVAVFAHWFVFHCISPCVSVRDIRTRFLPCSMLGVSQVCGQFCENYRSKILPSASTDRKRWQSSYPTVTPTHPSIPRPRSYSPHVFNVGPVLLCLLGLLMTSTVVAAQGGGKTVTDVGDLKGANSIFSSFKLLKENNHENAPKDVYGYVWKEIVNTLAALPGPEDRDSIFANLQQIVELTDKPRPDSSQQRNAAPDIDFSDIENLPEGIREELKTPSNDGFQPLCRAHQETLQALELFKQFLDTADAEDAAARARAKELYNSLLQQPESMYAEDDKDEYGTTAALLTTLQTLMQESLPPELTGGIDSATLKDVVFNSDPNAAATSATASAAVGRIEFAPPVETSAVKTNTEAKNNIARTSSDSADSWSDLFGFFAGSSDGVASQESGWLLYVLEIICALAILGGIVYAVSLSVSVKTADEELGIEDKMPKSTKTGADASNDTQHHVNGTAHPKKQSKSYPGVLNDSNASMAANGDTQLSILPNYKVKQKKATTHKHTSRKTSHHARPDRSSSEASVKVDEVPEATTTKDGGKKRRVKTPPTVEQPQPVTQADGTTSPSEATEEPGAPADSEDAHTDRSALTEDELTIEDAAMLLRHRTKGLPLRTQSKSSGGQNVADGVVTSNDTIDAQTLDDGFQKAGRRGRKKTGSAHGHEEVFLTGGDAYSSGVADAGNNNKTRDDVNAQGVAAVGDVTAPNSDAAVKEDVQTRPTAPPEQNSRATSPETQSHTPRTPVITPEKPIVAEASQPPLPLQPSLSTSVREVSGVTIDLFGDAIAGSPVIARSIAPPSMLPSTSSSASIPTMPWVEPDTRLSSSLFPGQVLGPQDFSIPLSRPRGLPPAMSFQDECVHLLLGRRVEELMGRLEMQARLRDPNCIHALKLVAQKVDLPTALLMADIIPPEAVSLVYQQKQSPGMRMRNQPISNMNQYAHYPTSFGMPVESHYDGRPLAHRTYTPPSHSHASPSHDVAFQHPLGSYGPSFMPSGVSPSSYVDPLANPAPHYSYPERWNPSHGLAPTSQGFYTPEISTDTMHAHVDTPVGGGEFMTSLGLPLNLGSFSPNNNGSIPTTSGGLGRLDEQPPLRGHQRNPSTGETILIPGSSDDRRPFLFSPDPATTLPSRDLL